jgi:hypothetical protein
MDDNGVMKREVLRAEAGRFVVCAEAAWGAGLIKVGLAGRNDVRQDEMFEIA